MTTAITLVDEDYVVYFVQWSPDDAMLTTQMGLKRADTLTEATSASFQLNGATEDGGVLYTANYGGQCGQKVRIRHIAGSVGAGFEGRALEVSVLLCDVTVQFGTDGAGASLVPTAQQVEDAIVASALASDSVVAVAQGAGTGLVSLSDYEALIGGANDGDCLKFGGRPPILRCISKVEVT